MTEFKGHMVEHMRQTARGWRCAACFHHGRIEQARKDGQPLSEMDRCAGCGETICDRHALGPQRDAHSRGVYAHLAMLEAPRTQVTEVRD